MAKKRRKKAKKIKKSFPVFLYLIGGFVILWLAFGIFLFFQKTPDSIYVSSENPKQGDTVFIRVKSDSDNVAGTFDNEKIVFYKKGKLSEWVAFLGIDADHSPGDYEISVDTGQTILIKKIKLSLADFSLSPTASAPSASQTGITQVKAVDNIVKNDNLVLKETLTRLTTEPYFNSPFSFPLSKIEKVGYPFGKFINFSGYKLQHLGVDLRAAENTSVYAVNDGKVVAAADLSNYGKTVIIDHGLDVFSLYLHLEEFKVSEGEMIKRGQLIGLSGDTGYTTAPHLHFSIRVGNSRVDPIAFIEATKKMNDNFILADLSQAFLNLFR